MAIKVECPQCGKKLKAPDRLAGKKAVCPDCKTPITVPRETAQRAVRTPSPSQAGPDLSGALDEEERLDEAAQRKPGRSKKPLFIIGGVVIAVVVVAAVIFLLMGRGKEPSEAPPARAQANPFDYLVPANANTIFDIDVAGVRKARLWETVRKALQGEEATGGDDAFEAFLRSVMEDETKTPEDRQRDEKIARLVQEIDRVYGGGVSQDGPFIFGISAREKIDWDSFLSLMRQSAEEEGATLEDTEILGYTVYEAAIAAGQPDPAAPCIVRVSDSFAIVGSKELVEETLGAMSAGRPVTAPAELLALAEAPAGTTIILATTALPEVGLPMGGMGMPPGEEPGEDASGGMQSFKGAALGITLSDGLALQGNVTFGNPDEAVGLKAQIDMMVGIFGMMLMQKPEAASALQSLRTEIEGGTVKIALNLTGEQIGKLIETAKEMQEAPPMGPPMELPMPGPPMGP